MLERWNIEYSEDIIHSILYHTNDHCHFPNPVCFQDPLFQHSNRDEDHNGKKTLFRHNLIELTNNILILNL